MFSGKEKNKFSGLSRHIYNLIDQGEHQKLDFKFAVIDSRKIARTLVAFSNSEGGRLLIGVKDNGKIAGIKSEEEYHMLEGAAKLYCKPEIKMDFKSWLIEGKTILEVEVSEGKQKPYYMLEENGKWMAWFRQDDENHLANPVLLQVWKNQNKEKGVLLKFSKKEEFLLTYLTEIEEISLDEFCKIAAINRRKAGNIISKLISLGMIDFKFRDGEFVYFAS